MENNFDNNLVNNPKAGQAMGIAALVLGIIAVIAAFIPCFGLIAILFGVLAIIFGAVGLSQAKKEGASISMPRAGLILGIVATAFVIIWILVIVGTVGKAAYDNKDKLGDVLDSVKVELDEAKDSIKLQQNEAKLDSTIVAK
jgi:hypothetical protein